MRISAGNYGGRLGKSFIYLHPQKTASKLSLRCEPGANRLELGGPLPVLFATAGLVPVETMIDQLESASSFCVPVPLFLRLSSARGRRTNEEKGGGR